MFIYNREVSRLDTQNNALLEMRHIAVVTQVTQFIY